MSVAHTSLAAYNKLVADGRMKGLRLSVYNTVRRHGSMTRERISELSGIRLQSVCGPVNQLVKAGVFIERRTTTDTDSGNSAKIVEIPHEAEQQGDLFGGS